MAATPCDISDELYSELKGLFSEREIVELSAAIAWENYRARFNRVFDVESEDYSEGAVCPMPHVS